MRETCGRPSPSTASKPEREQHREERQDGQQVARVDRVAEGEDDDDHGAPQREQPDRRRPGRRRGLPSGPCREPKEEERPAEEREDAGEEIARECGEHPERSVGRIAADLVAEELGGEFLRIGRGGIGVPCRDQRHGDEDRQRPEDRTELPAVERGDIGDQRRDEHDRQEALGQHRERHAEPAEPCPAARRRRVSRRENPDEAERGGGDEQRERDVGDRVRRGAHEHRIGRDHQLREDRDARARAEGARDGVGEEEDAAGREHPEQAEAGHADAEDLEAGGAEPVGDDRLLQPDLAVRRPRDQPVAGLDHPRPAIGVVALVGIVEDHLGADRHHHGEVGRGDDERQPAEEDGARRRAGAGRRAPAGGSVCRRRRRGSGDGVHACHAGGEPEAVGSGHLL